MFLVVFIHSRTFLRLSDGKDAMRDNDAPDAMLSKDKVDKDNTMQSHKEQEMWKTRHAITNVWLNWIYPIETSQSFYLRFFGCIHKKI